MNKKKKFSNLSEVVRQWHNEEGKGSGGIPEISFENTKEGFLPKEKLRKTGAVGPRATVLRIEEDLENPSELSKL